MCTLYLSRKIRTKLNADQIRNVYAWLLSTNENKILHSSLREIQTYIRKKFQIKVGKSTVRRLVKEFGFLSKKTYDKLFGEKDHMHFEIQVMGQLLDPCYRNQDLGIDKFAPPLASLFMAY